MQIHTLFKVANQILIHKKLLEIKKHFSSNSARLLIEHNGKIKKSKILKITNKKTGNIIEFKMGDCETINCIYLRHKGNQIYDQNIIESLKHYHF